MPPTLHTMSLAAHVADFHAALEDTENKNVRDALALLQGDALAQIMSFTPARQQQRGLSAVSPQVRLDSEMMVADKGYVRKSEPRSSAAICLSDSSDASTGIVPLFSIVTSGGDHKRHQTLTSLWWASRCGLPVELSVHNDDGEMLGHLTEALRSRVVWLTVSMRRSPGYTADNATVSSSAHPATVLTSLLLFRNLQSLSIQGKGYRAYTLEIAEMRSALTTAASLPIAALQLHGWKALHDLSAMMGSRFLRSLTVTYCGLRSLEGLLGYPMLEKLKASSCPHLTSVSALAGLPRLQEVEVRTCALQSLYGLDLCAALTDIDVSEHRNLQSLSALAGVPGLRRLVAKNCDIRSVQGLSLCAALTDIDINGNRMLHSLGDLSRAPWLQRVDATACDLRDLGAAGPWSALREMDVSYNRNLQSLSPLTSAPLLKRIHASECDIRSVEGLSRCTALTELILFANPNLQNFGDLSKAPCLEEVWANLCDLRDLGEAGAWSALREISVHYNTNLQSLSGLAGAPLLEEVHAEGCSIHDITVLGTCPNLRHVFKTAADYQSGE